MSTLMDDYNAAEKSLYDHVGFVPDWVVCPIDDCTDMYWKLVDENVFEKVPSVKYAETLEKFNSGGDYYADSIYTQRFYKKWVYRGEQLTMIMCHPHVDGVKWFRFFANDKEIK